MSGRVRPAVSTPPRIGHPLAGVLALALACVLGLAPSRPGAADAAPAPAAGTVTGAATTTPTASMTIETFLDRLMLAESGGHDLDVNPRSTAAGPFQFIASTFLDLVQRNFPTETAMKPREAILRLRHERAFARRVAAAYTQENADRLALAGIAATFPRLRLAHLVGVGAAIRILRVPPATPAAEVLGAPALHANPFLASLTAGALIARAARDLEVAASTGAGIAGRAGSRRARRDGVAFRCNIQRPACKKWVALAERRQGKAVQR